MTIEPNAHEVHGIEFIAALDAQVTSHEKHFKDRLQAVPGAWRNYRTARACLEKAIDSIYDTLPRKTLLHMQRMAENSEIAFRPKRIAVNNDMQLVSDKDLRMLINKAMASECAMCIVDGKEVKKCPLRKALMNIAPPEKISNIGCEYRDVAASHDLEEYI